MQEVSFDGGHTWREVACTVSIEEAARASWDGVSERLQADRAWREARKGEAKARAEALLLEHLDEGQKAEYGEWGRFHVVAGSGRDYGITPSDRHVRWAEGNRWYCLQSVRDVPDADWGLAVKLFLEADEAGFLKEANEYVLDRGWTYLSPMGHNCRCDIEFTGPIRFDTLAQARAYAERRNWRVDVTIDRGELPVIEHGSRWDRVLYPEQAYEVDGRATDERTVQLLWQAFQSREDGAFIPGSRGAETLSRHAQSFLAGLPCRFEIEVREGCDAVPAED